MDYKAEFIRIFNENIKRDGKDKLLAWLEKTDFFTAPASTKFHCACEGGLVQHSVNVYNVLRKKHFEEGVDDEETFAIVSLLHDVCKAGFYKVSTRNVKNPDTGKWESVPYFSVEDAFPYGHGEKSVFLIERFIHLKTPEAMAIRWHMGGFDDSARAGSFTMAIAFEKYDLCVKTHMADLEATYLLEKRTSIIENGHRKDGADEKK